MKKIQIGVMGSMLDTKLENSLKDIAKKVGEEIAKHKAILVFGFEGDFDSLPTIAAKRAEEIGGQTIAFLRGSRNMGLNGLKSIKIITGLDREGGRGFPLILSCDAIICICGGSGTLTEISIAYQTGIPTIVLKNSGGWSQKLANQFLDGRKKQKIIGVKTPKEAVLIALKVAKIM